MGRPRPRLERVLLLAAFLALAGCQPGEAPRLVIDAAAIHRQGGAAELRARIDFRPSEVQLDALEHGVPLVLGLTVGGDGAAPPARLNLSLRYFPLSRRYRLRVEPGAQDASFALRGYLFDALDRLRVPLAHDPCVAPGSCRIEVHFDYAALPGALRLPALLRGAWRVPPAHHAVDAS
ncbi:MAG TPA: hypothetical protein VFG73_03305 [Rhodanobacteraceae bacterium]|nr:hypothetical protein [Rhodanobacteraceae bacterium]